MFAKSCQGSHLIWLVLADMLDVGLDAVWHAAPTSKLWFQQRRRASTRLKVWLGVLAAECEANCHSLLAPEPPPPPPKMLPATFPYICPNSLMRRLPVGSPERRWCHNPRTRARCPFSSSLSNSSARPIPCFTSYSRGPPRSLFLLLLVYIIGSSPPSLNPSAFYSSCF